MSVRVTYEHELGLLNQDLMEMAHMVERAIEQTFTAFEDQDFQMAEDIIKGDRTAVSYTHLTLPTIRLV